MRKTSAIRLATVNGAAAPARGESPRIALALAGGGPLGAIYEIGALCALQESLRGVDFTALDHYVGVSAGGFIAAALANGMTPDELRQGFIDNSDESAEVFDPSWLTMPAWREFARRALRVPGLSATALWRGLVQRRSFISALERLGPALPTGVFANDEVDRRLAHLFSQPGRSNDFRQLATRLTLVATDLDSGEAAPFGQPGWDHVPISLAVAASAALPGLFPPVPIGGRWYVDGALKKTLHARVLLDMPLDLVIALNPLVPFDARHGGRHRVLGGRAIPRLVDGGLPVVLSQTFRTLIHSRLELGLKGYESSHPGVDIVLFEPDQRDPEMFLANTFGYARRRSMAEHAYQQTRADLRSRRSALRMAFARHGLALDDAVLDDPDRRLVSRRLPPRSRAARAMQRLDEVLSDLERALAAREPSPR